ncbi:TonB-dependent receptor [Flavobacterium sp. ZT3R18]|nr:TonB-dependent receptor [Flavobacterium sp. ZT3R18]
MSQLLVNVKIVGNIAYTTAEMHFFNKSTRQMEAELLFPLPEGVSVSRYAIDINGKMREAVPVNKNKGKQVFEAVEHRRVDPGLLEKVEGNNFKTRIYPILPNGERIVLIGYEQELSSYDATNLAYQLVSKYAQKLDVFEVNINVLGATSNPIVMNGDQASSMEKAIESSWSQSYVTSIKKINYQPSEKLLLKIPIQQEIPSVVMQSVDDQHFFYANTVVESSKIKKKNPNSIGLIWDVSLSCKNRDLKKELDLLDNYFKQIKNTQVTLYLLSYNFEKNQIFTISNGDWSVLKTKLENTKYDGGTRFSQIKLPTHDEYLFFTDGLSSLSNNQLDKTNKPIYTISSLVSSDYAFLNYNSLKTGGSFINLNQLNTTQAVDKMVYSSLKFLGIKENYLVTEIYPSIGTAVSGNFSVSGISLKPKNEIVLLFGYDDKAIIEKKISLDADRQNTKEVNLEKLWAQKKIANLELQYKQNAEEIETMGKKYGIITQNTSLIVLENISDYIAYDIVPPTELRAEFDRIVKGQRDSQLAEQHNNWDNIEDYRYKLQSWWNKNTKYTAAVPLRKSKKKSDQVGFVRPVVARAEEMTETIKGDPDAEMTVEAVSVSFDATPPPPPPARAEESPKIEELKDKKVGSESIGNDERLQEVVVVAYGNKKSESAVISNDLSGKVEGVNITNSEDSGAVNKIVADSISNLNKNNDSTTKVNSWNPDRMYLKVLTAAPAEKKYEVYLELRATQENNPSFYFDVANYFYNTGNKQKALLVLSTIADLGLENHQLYKSLTYVLRQWEAYEDALFTASQVVKWRSHEPQSHRDLGLTLEDNKQYQAAFDELTKALEVNYYGEMSGQYAGVEDIILMDINRLVTDHPNVNTEKLDKKYLNKMPVGIRIILNWNQMDTDIDLHIIEPTNEECYYGHTDTEAGARFSKDFTQGYGPEQYLLRNTIKGKYLIKTNYFGESTLTQNGPATIMVEIYTQKNGKTERKLQTIQLGQIKENQDLAKIMID